MPLQVTLNLTFTPAQWKQIATDLGGGSATGPSRQLIIQARREIRKIVEDRRRQALERQTKLQAEADRLPAVNAEIADLDSDLALFP